MIKSIAVTLILSILIQPFAIAQTNKDKSFIPGVAAGDSSGERGASEFVMRRFPGERLIPVRILGGVRSPGTYYFPEGMDLVSALSLSGGLSENSDPEAVKWTQFSSQKENVLDLGDIMRKPKELNPTLGANDILYVEAKTTWFSNNFVSTLAVVGSILGIVLGAKALSND